MKTKVNKGKEEARTKDTEEKENPVSMEALETAIRYWEDALDVYRSSSDQGALTNEEEKICVIPRLIQIASRFKQNLHVIRRVICICTR
ncbi:hypothetical protein M8J76_017308 [Diaphorina citri]|nr:hypothetical protein M8J76_017308 [Diaphorina citri]